MSTEMLAFLMGAKDWSKPIEDACIRWGIVSGPDKARFIAQLHVETGGFKYFAELTNYSPQGLLNVFGPTPRNPDGRNGLKTLQQAQQLVAAGPRAVFNHVYGGKWGRENLGNTQPDDGWDFRGRGPIQTTGRENYLKASIGMYGDDRLIDEPDALLVPSEGASAAAYYWHSRRCNGIEDIREVTRKINPGLMHLDRRIAQTQRAYDILDHMLQAGR